MKRVLLLTGKPGSGKTTLIRQAIKEAGIDAGGFYTEEIRETGVRHGFRIMTLDGKTAVLAHTGIRGAHKVSRYGVDVGELDRVGVVAILDAIQRRELIVIDEIGKMELFSDAFRQAVSQAMSHAKPVLGTIMLAPNPFADVVKRNPDVELVNVTVENRRAAGERLRAWLRSIKKEEEHEQDTGADQA